MSRYSQSSQNKLVTCHEELVEVCFTVIPNYDHTIICGLRLKEAQNEAFANGYSMKQWPDSEHNSEDPEELSNAVDIAPYHAIAPHIRWEAEREFIYLAGHMMQAAAALGVELIWGGDWDADRDLYDRNLPFDLGHFERSKR